MDIAIVLSLLVIAIILFATEKFSVDVITLVLIIVLTGIGILTPSEAFDGFSNDFIIILGSIFVISGALQETGILDQLGNRLVYLVRKNPRMLKWYITFVPGIVSAFMNNTTVTALFINPIIGVSRKLKYSPSKLLMPLAFATILGGTCTLIGTSTNVAGSAYLDNAGLGGLSMFELLPAGAIIFAVGIVYLVTFGYRLLPDHKVEGMTDIFNMRKYLSEILVMEGSPLIGQRIFISDLSKFEFRILNVLRGDYKFIPDSRTVINPGDTLLVEGDIEKLLQIKDESGVEIKADTLDVADLQKEDIKVVEVLITPMTDFLQQTIKEARFRQRYGLVVLAVHRHGETLHNKIGDIELQVGDVILVQGPQQQIDYLKGNHSLAILDKFNPRLFDKKKGLLTLSFFIGAVIIGTIGWLPLSISFVTAAVLTVLIRTLTPERAYEYVDWRSLVLIGGMSAFGTAMVKTGADHFLAALIIDGMSSLGPLAIMTGFMIVTIILTQPLSNAAAALVMLPIAIQTAAELEVSQRSFAIAVILSASMSLVTPFEPACILVYGPGKYKIWDYIKMGGILTVIMLVILVFLVPYLWPF
jgi:di/tricarboxylate transporter